MKPKVNSEEWLECLSQTQLFKLAKKNLIRTNKVKKIKIGDIPFYEFDPIQVILEGLKIRIRANRARIKI